MYPRYGARKQYTRGDGLAVSECPGPSFLEDLRNRSLPDRCVDRFDEECRWKGRREGTEGTGPIGMSRESRVVEEARRRGLSEVVGGLRVSGV